MQCNGMDYAWAYEDGKSITHVLMMYKFIVGLLQGKLKKKISVKLSIFPYLSVSTYVLGAQKMSY